MFLHDIRVRLVVNIITRNTEIIIFFMLIQILLSLLKQHIHFKLSNGSCENVYQSGITDHRILNQKGRFLLVILGGSVLYVLDLVSISYVVLPKPEAFGLFFWNE